MSIPLPTLCDTLDPLTAALDGVEHDQRLHWMRGLGRAELRTLYALAESGDPLDLAHFHLESDRIVVHHGQNSLFAFNHFQKRVCHLGDAPQGYNHQSLSWLTGPGHFVLTQDGDEVIFDYTIAPATVHPDFPPLAPNDAGFGRFVYGGMIDRVRRVSEHCVIGAAFRNDKPEGAWFMLIRED